MVFKSKLKKCDRTGKVGCSVGYLIIPAYFYTSMFEVNIVMTLVNIVNCIAYSMFLFALLRPFLFREQKKQLPPEE
jgi:hypothetical protein